MNKIAVELDELFSMIERFYDKTKHSFLTLNALSVDEDTIEVQWIFSHYYEKEHITLFYALINPNQTIPSITSLIPSAVISQREIVDMFGVKVEDTQAGLYLDEDSVKAPLRVGYGL
ncbi:NADH-quinone oxidoreductase subunit C [Candidatus Marinarcus aquaticus]|uniref:NADH dehydrogenase FAD-containing subunit n=1 Tax=Candidatus Marinarcus aquaticus TaxID=2044504 RepID=A0A4Q0XPU5_9BACT|nr:NADH-quinone oxidoreductase subunit C [Candidatus Marinarcus aquaticus]RXJ54442.1 NADH dehydrogenase FAD-containing subunit [Candidatus Marinarcus aquaticus]